MDQSYICDSRVLTSKSGKLYYAWTIRDKDGNSDIPDIYNSGNSIETGADSKISIYLNNLDPDNAIDLYVRLKGIMEWRQFR